MYSNLDSTRNETLPDNWERRYLASCWEGPSSVLPNLTACRVCSKSVLNILTDGYMWEMKRMRVGQSVLNILTGGYMSEMKRMRVGQSVLDILTDGYMWEMKRASWQVLAADTGVVQKQCCAQCMQSVYIKANMVSVCVDKMSVCVDKNWAVPGRFFQSLPVPCGAGDKQGRAWQGRAARAAAVGGRARCHFY